MRPPPPPAAAVLARYFRETMVGNINSKSISANNTPHAYLPLDVVAVHVICDHQPAMALRVSDTIAVIIILGRGADERALCAELRGGGCGCCKRRGRAARVNKVSYQLNSPTRQLKYPLTR